jgi:hypothetical protein
MLASSDERIIVMALDTSTDSILFSATLVVSCSAFSVSSLLSF